MIIDFKAPCWALKNAIGEDVYVNPALVLAVAPQGGSLQLFLATCTIEARMPEGGVEPASELTPYELTAIDIAAARWGPVDGYVPGEEDIKVGGTD